MDAQEGSEPARAARCCRGERAVLAAAWCAWAALALRFAFLADDAYISFRYARNWATGVGLRYNPGEHVPVEGYSNFLWVALEALLVRLGLALPAVVPAVSAALAAALLLLVQRSLLRARDLPRGAALAGFAWLACATPFAVWSTGGLETMSFALLLFAAFERLCLAPGGPRGAAGGALLALVALSRPEGAAWSALLLALAAVTRRARGEPWARSLGAAAALFAGVLALYTVWRVDHFGSLVPNASAAKLAAGVRADRLLRGLRYVAAQALSVPSLWAVLPAGAALLLRGPRSPWLAAGVLALAFPAWAVAVSGDFMAFGRFLVPGLAFAAPGVAALCAPLASAGRRWALAGAGAALALLGALPGLGVETLPRALERAVDFRPQLGGRRGELAHWRRQRDETRRWLERGRALAQISAPGDSIFLSAIGAIGYASGLFVHDRLGLVTREVAELPPPDDVSDRMPGHDNPATLPWFFERGIRPTFLRANLAWAPDRAGLAERARTSARNLRALGLDREYVADVHLVVPDEGGGEPDGVTFLLTWRLLPAGAVPEPARAERERLLAGYLAGGALPSVRGRAASRDEQDADPD